VADELQLPKIAQAMVDALATTLGASVALLDQEAGRRYLAESGAWSSEPLGPSNAKPSGSVRARINDRWTLVVFSDRPLRVDAEARAAWVARQLGPHLPQPSEELVALSRYLDDVAASGYQDVQMPLVLARMFSSKNQAPEHLLIALAGTEPGARFVAMVGVRVDDPIGVGERIAKADADGPLQVLADPIARVRICICFSSTRAIEGMGSDWALPFLKFQVEHHGIMPVRPLIVHARRGTPIDLDGLDAYLRPDFPRFDVRTQLVDPGEPYLRLPDVIRDSFRDLAERGADAPEVARARFELIAPRLDRAADMGRNVSYLHGSALLDDLLRATLRP
jgi:hypothetical protein